MVACDGSVSGTWQTAAVNRVASPAKASSAGVSPRVDPYDPSRSARSVSMVMSTIGGREAAGPLAGDSPPLHAAHERTRIAASADARMRFSVQLASMHRRIARLAAVLLLTCAATAFAQPAPV